MNNCTITVDDIKRAETIYGPPTPLLQGKMIRTKPSRVNTHTTSIPHNILHNYPTVRLCIDLVYINKLPFLHTKSSHINFLTIQFAQNRTQGTIKKLLVSVIDRYQTRGFNVSDIFGDNEFDVPSLHDFFRPITIHSCAPEEHVPQIERQNRSTKEQLRTICHSLPYKRYTKLMTIHLAEYGNHWSNAFPSHTGVSTTLSPSNIIEGKRKPDFNHQHIGFGSYALVHVGTKNNLKARSVPAIALRPSNDWGGYFFMSLITGRKLHAYKWVELPINDEIIERVNVLALEEKQPILSNGTILVEWGRNDNIDNESSYVEYEPNQENNTRIINENSIEEEQTLHIDEDNTNTHDTGIGETDIDDDNHLTEIEAQMNKAMMEINEEQDSIILDEENNAEHNINEDFFEPEDDVSYDDNASSEEREERDIMMTRNVRDQTQHANDNSTHNSTDTDPHASKENTVVQEIDNDTTPMDVTQSARPRRAAAGSGIERLEPIFGGKEHLSYRMKLGLLQKARRRQTQKTRVCLMMREV